MSSVISSDPYAHNTGDLPEMPSRASMAAADLIEGLRKSWLWMALATQDIKLRYRGSLLGPLWLTISTVVMVGTMGVLYPKLFHTDVRAYFPFLTVGLVFWGFLSSVITEGCGTFLSVNSIIQQVRLPHSLHAYRFVYRNLLVLAHNAVIIPIVFFIFPPALHWNILTVVPALVLLAVNSLWIGILLGMVSARFRDVAPIVSSFLQVVFFVTPIFWSPDLLGEWKTPAELNPMFAAIDVVRAPLLGLEPAPYSWFVLIMTTLCGGGLTFLLFARFRARIPFWV